MRKTKIGKTMNKKLGVALLILGVATNYSAYAEIIVGIDQALPTGNGQSLGYIKLRNTDGGLELTPYLHGLAPGEHGFHIHQVGSCAPITKDGVATPALSAGGHFDPEQTNKHEGPLGHGHRGDMVVLSVNVNGQATRTTIVPRLNEDLVKGKSIVIHAGGDNYSDAPAALGGGGARVACGLI